MIFLLQITYLTNTKIPNDNSSSPKYPNRGDDEEKASQSNLKNLKGHQF